MVWHPVLVASHPGTCSCQLYSLRKLVHSRRGCECSLSWSFLVAVWLSQVLSSRPSTAPRLLSMPSLLGRWVWSLRPHLSVWALQLVVLVDQLPVQCFSPPYILLHQTTLFLVEQPQLSGIALTLSLLGLFFCHQNALFQCVVLLSLRHPRSPVEISHSMSHADLLCFALCADFVFTWECCKVSAGGRSREDPGDTISRRPVPEFIVILGHISTHIHTHTHLSLALRWLFVFLHIITIQSRGRA